MKTNLFVLLMFSLLLGGCGGKKASEANNAKEVSVEDSTAVDKGKDEPAKEPQSLNENQEPRGVIYRSDGFHPGVASEWVQVAYNDERDQIIGIWYWSTADETKIPLKIIKVEFATGELGGVTGELSFTGDDEKIGFGMIEERFNFSFADERFQEFEYEDTE